MSTIIKHSIPLIAGIIFGFGLAVSKMVEPQRVIGFLDPFGTWDPTLAFVMAGGLFIMVLANLITRGSDRPVYAEYFRFPTRTKLDMPLIAGSAVFGAGWGLGGFCPGPVISATPFLNQSLMYGLLAYILGVAVAINLKKIGQKAPMV
jgi:uncharacterized protein